MNNKLTQEYKDDLYGKVLEKKRIRNIKRKKMLSVFIVFISVVGFTTLGFSLLEKEDYKNFFISETKNITFNDEYEYFDDLGIKLEFINIDKNSLTLGINIKYENIADYDVDFEEIQILDQNDEKMLMDSIANILEKTNVKKKSKDLKINSKDEIVYILKYEMNYILDADKFIIKIGNLWLKNSNDEIKKINYEKKISIEE